MLASEPFFLTIDDILRLTPYQARAVYFCKRDKYGQVELPSAPDVGGPGDILMQYAKLIRLTPGQTEQYIRNRRAQQQECIRRSKEASGWR